MVVFPSGSSCDEVYTIYLEKHSDLLFYNSTTLLVSVIFNISVINIIFLCQLKRQTLYPLLVNSEM